MTPEEANQIAKDLRGMAKSIEYTHPGDAKRIQDMLVRIGLTRCTHCGDVHDTERCLASLNKDEIDFLMKNGFGDEGQLQLPLGTPLHDPLPGSAPVSTIGTDTIDG